MRPRPFPVALALAATLAVTLAVRARAEDEPGVVVEKRLADVAACFDDAKKPVEDIFDRSFLAKVPASKLHEIFAYYHEHGGKLTGSKLVPSPEKKPSPWSSAFQLELEKGTVAGSIAVAPKEPHKVVGLFFKNLEPRLASFEELEAELKKLSGKVSFAAARLGGDAPKPVASLAPDESLAIGSAFKLYILGALLDDVAAGKRKLEDVTTLRKETRSLPSGFLQTWPEGAPVTLHTLASLMISISDNTATDTLLETLGRERVEKELATLGNAKPERTIPFLGTREMFKLKWAKPELGDEWVKADLARKRAILGELANVPLPDVGRIDENEPTKIAEIEWFASAMDLVRAMDGIRKLTDGGPAAAGRGILSITPGAGLEGWKYVGYKGGSEPGVLELSWLLEREDGAWFALALGWNDPEDAVDLPKLLGFAQKAADLLRKS